MRTDLKGQQLNVEKVESKTIDDKSVKGVRRSLHPLQEAAGDKENLVGAGRLKQMPSLKENTINIIAESKPINKKVKSTKVADSKTTIIEDLTSEAGPSKAYWETLAERRRTALEDALKENEELHEKIVLLEEENAHCKEMLEETKALVETLTEMLGEDEEEQQVLRDGIE